MTVTISDMSTTVLPGVALEDVTINSKRTGSSYVIERMKLRFYLSSFLLRKLKVGYSVHSKALSVAGYFSRGVLGRDYADMVINLDDLNLSQIFAPGFLNENLIGAWKQKMAESNPMMGGMLAGLTLQGSLSGDIELMGGRKEMQQMELSELDGEVDLKGKKLLAEGLIPGGLDLGNLILTYDLDKGKGNLGKLEVKSKDLILTGKGTMKFEKAPKQGSINLEMQLTIPETARPNLTGSLNMALIPLGAEVKGGKSAFRVTGALGGRVPPRISPMN
jgi:type II secretion system protein N